MNLLQQTEKIYKNCWCRATLDEANGVIPEGYSFAEWVELKWKNEMINIKEILAPKYHELKQILVESRICSSDDESLQGRFALITLRPEENTVSLSAFKNDIKKLVDKSLFLDYHYVLEQTGKSEEEMGRGFHTHILAKLKKHTNVQHITTACNFIKYNCIIQVGSKNGKKFLKTKNDYDYCMNYIQGEKHNKEKEAAVQIDKIWRVRNEIQSIYSRNQDQRPAEI